MRFSESRLRLTVGSILVRFLVLEVCDGRGGDLMKSVVEGEVITSAEAGGGVESGNDVDDTSPHPPYSHWREPPSAADKEDYNNKAPDQFQMPEKEKMENKFDFDPLNPKNVVLVAWGSSTDKHPLLHPYPTEYLTIGTFISTNAIVCVPSASVPIAVRNVSNWLVHHVIIGDPPIFIDKHEFILLFHPKFMVMRNSPHRLALIILNESGEKKAKEMIPLMLVAAPFLPSVQEQRHDDYTLTMCTMVVYTADELGSPGGKKKFVAVPFVTEACKYDKNASGVYKEKLCGYTKMMKNTQVTISKGFMYPNDLGAPLVCGNILVGLYSGIQNLYGNRYKKGTEVIDKNMNLSPDRLKDDEQYTFDNPGGLVNFLFLGAFINQTAKKMKWSMKTDMSQTGECIDVQSDFESEELSTETPEGDVTLAETLEGEVKRPESSGGDVTLAETHEGEVKRSELPEGLNINVEAKRKGYV